MPRAPLAALAIGIIVAVSTSCSDDSDGTDADTAAATEAASSETTATADTASDESGGADDGTSDDATSDDATSDDGTSDDATSDGGDVSVAVSASPYSPIAAALEVSADQPVTVSATATAGDHVVEVPPHSTGSNEIVVPLVGMRESSTYALDIVVVDGGGETLATVAEEFTTGELPEDVPDFEVEYDPDRAQPGVTIVELSPNYPEGEEPDPPVGSPVVAIDHDGEIVWFYRNSAGQGGIEPTPDGTFLAQYFPVGVREFDVLGNVVGNWQIVPEVIVDEADDEEPAWIAPTRAAVDGNPGDMDATIVDPEWVELTSFHHELFKMPDGNLLTLATTNHELTPEQRTAICPDDETGAEFDAISDVIVEFEPDGTVLRTWDVWDAIDIDEVPGAQMCETGGLLANDEFRDWTHGNAVIYDPDRDAIIVSLRHTNQVVAFDHLDETGPQSQVRWVLGAGSDALPLDGDPPYHQHAVELQADGTILLNDNGNGRPGTRPGDPDNPTYSRAVLYEVDDSSEDPSEWTATQLWEHLTDDIDGSVLFAPFLGDADRLLNGNVLIDHGGIIPDEDPRRGVIIEVVPDGTGGGEIVWSTVVTGDPVGFNSYRAERLPSLYFGPAVVGDAG